MGLSINVYKNATKAKRRTSKTIRFFNQEDMSQNVKVPGYYLAERDNTVGWGRPYSYYNRFREWLCLLATGLTTEVVWANPNADLPFIELIDFADNEGVFDTECCQRLHEDFLLWDDLAKQSGGSFYDDFHQIAACFKIAAENKGCIEYY